MTKFKKWLRNAKFPQGNFETWQRAEIERFAFRAWKAGIKYSKLQRRNKYV